MFNQEPAPVPATSWTRPSPSSASRACCPAPRTSTPRCSPGSSGTSSRPGCASATAADLPEPGIAARGVGRQRRRAAHPRRGRRGARLRQHLPAPRPRTAAVRRDGQAAQHRLPVPLVVVQARRFAAQRAELPQCRVLRPVPVRARPAARRRLARLDLRRPERHVRRRSPITSPAPRRSSRRTVPKSSRSSPGTPTSWRATGR